MEELSNGLPGTTMEQMVPRVTTVNFHLVYFCLNSIANLSSVGNFGGRVLSYNLSEPFSPGDNVTGILLKKDINKLIGGTGTTSGIFQNFIDGALLANDYEFFLYGGMSLQTTKASDAPDKDDALLYAVDQYGAEKTAFKAGWDATRKLSDGVTPYIAFGGAANAPSEQKAWYFSGMTAPNLGPIISNGGDDTRPVNVSDRLIMVDMETQGDEVWTNTSLPGNVKGRANPEVVWVPVGEEGILVVLGGVTHPEWTGQKSHKSDDEEASVSVVVIHSTLHILMSLTGRREP